MLEELKQRLISDCGVNPGEPILIGVSGGPDSLCLLDALDQLEFHPVAAHFNHQLRNEADREAEAIETFCHERSLTFVTGQDDVRALAHKHRQSIEEAAREARYRFLFEQATLHGIEAVAVGHTADDQVETVLMHLLRGAGLSGLSGMPYRSLPNAWSDAIPLVRPLLPFWRGQIEMYCRERGLQPVIDSTNLDTAYYRNRLRHELIPYLSDYNPSVKQIIWRTADILRGDLAIVSKLEEEVWKDCLEMTGPGYVALKRNVLTGQMKGLQRRILRHAIACLRPGLRDIDYPAIERGLRHLAIPGSPTGVDFIAGLTLLTEADLVWVADWDAELPTVQWPRLIDNGTILTVPGVVDLPDSWSLTIQEATDLERARVEAIENDDPFQAWVALDKMEGPIFLRTRLAGDRFKPLGMEGHSVKLAEFMLNQKIPGRARGTWPLVCSGDEIVWIAGIRSAHPFRVEDRTRRIAHLELIKKDEKCLTKTKGEEPDRPAPA